MEPYVYMPFLLIIHDRVLKLLLLTVIMPSCWLQEELIRAKSSKSVGSQNGYFQGRNVRESLNQLRVPLFDTTPHR